MFHSLTCKLDKQCVFVFSHFLWNISKPGKTGIPRNDLSDDPEAVVSTDTLTNNTTAVAYERIITKTFAHYNIPLEITPSIRATCRSKLWRMGKHWSTHGSTKRSQQLDSWNNGHDSTWEFNVDKMELNKQLLTKKRKVEVQLDKVVTKRRKLENEVAVLKETNKQQAKVIMNHIYI